MRNQWTVLINAENKFYEKTMNNLCSEQRIIYAKKRVNNFLNNAEHKIILCRKQWTIFMRKQWTVLINAENRFYECSK